MFDLASYDPAAVVGFVAVGVFILFVGYRIFRANKDKPPAGSTGGGGRGGTGGRQDEK